MNAHAILPQKQEYVINVLAILDQTRKGTITYFKCPRNVPAGVHKSKREPNESAKTQANGIVMNGNGVDHVEEKAGDPTVIKSTG